MSSAPRVLIISANKVHKGSHLQQRNFFWGLNWCWHCLTKSTCICEGQAHVYL